MDWNIWDTFFLISMCVLACSVLAAAGFALWKQLRQVRLDRVLKPFYLFFGLFFAGSWVLLFLPTAADAGLYSGEAGLLLREGNGFWNVLRLILLAFHNTLQMFTVDADKVLIRDFVLCGEGLKEAYRVCLSVLYAVSPLLTMTFLVSFFSDFLSYMRYFFRFFCPVYAFSELNDRSLALAEDIRKNRKRVRIVFADVGKETKKAGGARIERAEHIGALLFSRKLPSVPFGIHCPASELHFYVLGEDEAANVQTSSQLVKKYGKRRRSFVYLLSGGVEGEMLMQNLACEHMEVHRINETRMMVYRLLREEGPELFKRAVPEGGRKAIRAMILGLGYRGTEMLKALAWYGQIDGYSIRIDAYDSDLDAKDRLAAEMSVLNARTGGSKRNAGDARYEIFVHPGTDAMSKSFADGIARHPAPTYVFICLGSDDTNIRAAVRLRTLFERKGADPVIHAVVGNAETGKLLEGVKTFDEQKYNIRLVGDLGFSYSEQTLTPEDLNDKALDIHWGYNAGKTKEQCKQSFYGYEYNYYSSLSAAIHMELREELGITASGLSDEAIRAMEHRRWCAFMLTEGYAPPEPGEQARLKNHLAKTHPDLVVYRRLDEKERQKNAFAVGGRGNPAGQANEPNEPNGEEPDGE